MEIKRIKINKINPAPYNPRLDLQPGDPEYERIKKSIETFDLVEPLVMNRRGNRLISGHQRLKILKERGDKEVEAVIVDFDEAQEKACNIALNRALGDWNFPSLTALLAELKGSLDDIEITGFDEAEIDSLFNEYLPHELKPETERARIDLFKGYMESFEQFADEFGYYAAGVSVWDGNNPHWLERKRKLNDLFFEWAGETRAFAARPMGGLMGNVCISKNKTGENSLLKQRQLKKSKISFVGLGSHKTDEQDGYVSLFDPVLAELISKAYTPVSGNIYDPFAGDTRPVISAGHGFNYAGCEIRQDQVAVINRELKRLKLKAKIFCQSSADPVPLKDGWADMVYSCPPYYDIEVYSDLEGDISNAPSYADFLSMFEKCLAEAWRILKSPAFMVLIVGNMTDKNRKIIDFRQDTKKIILDLGGEIHDTCTVIMF